MDDDVDDVTVESARWCNDCKSWHINDDARILALAEGADKRREVPAVADDLTALAGSATWTIRAHVQITPAADWTGHLVPQVVQANSLTEALDRAQAQPLVAWMHEEDENGDQIDCSDCPRRTDA